MIGDSAALYLYTDDGIKRQSKIHVTEDGAYVMWSPRFPGDPWPWFDADGEWDDSRFRYSDRDLATLGTDPEFEYGEWE